MEHEFIDGVLYVKSASLNDRLSSKLSSVVNDMRVKPKVFLGMTEIIQELMFPQVIKKSEKNMFGETFVEFDHLLSEISAFARHRGDTRSFNQVLEVYPETEQDGVRIVEAFLTSEMDKILVEDLTAG